MASAATLTFFCLKIAFGNLSSNKIIFLTIIGILSLYTQGEGELWRGHEQYPHSTDWTYILWWPHLLFPIYARLNIFRKAKDGKQVRRYATERVDPVEAVEHSDNLQRVAWSMIAHPGNRYAKEKEHMYRRSVAIKMLTGCAAHQVGAGHQAGLDRGAHSSSEQGTNQWLYATGDGDPCDGVVLADHEEDVDLHPDGTHGWQGRHCSHWTQQCCTQGTL